MKDDILNWFAHGERGVSSEAMACAVMGIEPNKKRGVFGNHPHDPDDFKRCVYFLNAVPEARNHLKKVAALSDTWKRIIDRWDELEFQFNNEIATRSAPVLYAKMKDIIYPKNETKPD